MIVERHFTFKVKTGDGEVRQGMISAETPNAARAKLQTELGRVLSLVEVVERRDDAPQIHPRAVSTAELASATRQLSLLLRAGISLPRAFELVASADSIHLAVVFAWVAEEVRRGKSMSEALAVFATVFDSVYLTMVRAGEMSGRLDTNLSRMADLLDAREQLRRRVSASLAYPVVVAVMALVVLALFVGFILPTVRPSYEDMGVELPLLTRVVLGASDLALNPFVLAGLAACAYGAFRFFKRYVRTQEGRVAVENGVRRLPLIGITVEKQEVVGVLYILASMLDSGVTLGECLVVAEQAATSARVGMGLHLARQHVMDGYTFTEAVRKAAIFPNAVLQILEVGETSGTMVRMMRSACRLFEEDVEMRLSGMATLLEPLIMLAVGIVVGVITLAAFLPGMSLVSQF